MYLDHAGKIEAFVDLLDKPDGIRVFVPENLKGQISSLMSDPSSAVDMMLQLVLLGSEGCCPSRVELLHSKLIYLIDQQSLNWGIETYRAPEGYQITQWLELGGRLFWIEKPKDNNDISILISWDNQERRVAYKYMTEFQEIDGKPCFIAELDEMEDKESTKSVVVWGEEVYGPYPSIRLLANGNGSPVYAARLSDSRDYGLFFAGRQVCRAYSIKYITPYNYGVAVVLQGTDESGEELLHVTSKAVQRLTSAGSFRKPLLIDGKLAVAETYQSEDVRACVSWGGQSFDQKQLLLRIKDWEVDIDPDKKFFVFTAQNWRGEWGIWINMTCVDSGAFYGNQLEFDYTPQTKTLVVTNQDGDPIIFHPLNKIVS